MRRSLSSKYVRTTFPQRKHIIGAASLPLSLFGRPRRNALAFDSSNTSACNYYIITRGVLAPQWSSQRILRNATHSSQGWAVSACERDSAGWKRNKTELIENEDKMSTWRYFICKEERFLLYLTVKMMV